MIKQIPFYNSRYPCQLSDNSSLMAIWQRNLGVSRVRVLVFVPVLHFFSYFLIFRPLKLKYAYPQMEHEQLCQRGRLITENKGYQGRIEALMKRGNGSTGAPIRGQLGRRNLPASRHWKDLRSCAAKCSRLLCTMCVSERTAGRAEAVQEASLVLTAENSKSSAEH